MAQPRGRDIEAFASAWSRQETRGNPHARASSAHTRARPTVACGFARGHQLQLPSAYLAATYTARGDAPSGQMAANEASGDSAIAPQIIDARCLTLLKFSRFTATSDNSH